MGLINNIIDSFKAADFEVESTMKVNALCESFRKNFGLSLRIYKGVQLADGRMTINTLDQRTTKAVNTNAPKLKIKANQKVGDVETLFMSHFGIKVQIANYEDTKLSDNDLSLGDARRSNNK